MVLLESFGDIVVKYIVRPIVSLNNRVLRPIVIATAIGAQTRVGPFKHSIIISMLL